MTVQIASDEARRLAEAVLAAAGAKASARRAGTVRTTARVVGRDSSGRTYVHIPGGVRATPMRRSAADFEVGDEVEIEVGRGMVAVVGNVSDPAARSSSVADAAAAADAARGIARQSAKDADAALGRSVAAEAAAEAAAAAAALAEAPDQHFWSDSSGIHVAEDTKSAWDEEYAASNHGTIGRPTESEPWHNILLNSLGLLLRSGLRNLVGMTRSATSFFDGSGNAASNVVASFGSEGAVIGKAGFAHAEITPTSLKMEYGTDSSIVPLEIANRYVQWSRMDSGYCLSTATLPASFELGVPESGYVHYSVDGPISGNVVFPQSLGTEDIDSMSTMSNKVSYDSQKFSYDPSTHMLTVLDTSEARAALATYGKVYIAVAYTLFSGTTGGPPNGFLLQIKIAGRPCFPTFIYSAVPTDNNGNLDESQLPITPCIVVDASDGALYYCSG